MFHLQKETSWVFCDNLPGPEWHKELIVLHGEILTKHIQSSAILAVRFMASDSTLLDRLCCEYRVNYELFLSHVTTSVNSNVSTKVLARRQCERQYVTQSLCFHLVQRKGKQLWSIDHEHGWWGFSVQPVNTILKLSSINILTFISFYWT